MFYCYLDNPALEANGDSQQNQLSKMTWTTQCSCQLSVNISDKKCKSGIYGSSPASFFCLFCEAKLSSRQFSVSRISARISLYNFLIWLLANEGILPKILNFLFRIFAFTMTLYYFFFLPSSSPSFHFKRSRPHIFEAQTSGMPPFVKIQSIFLFVCVCECECVFSPSSRLAARRGNIEQRKCWLRGGRKASD